MSNTIYHVCRGEWDGNDLLPISDRMKWSDETAAYILANWPDLHCGYDAEDAEAIEAANRYYETEGREVHCHATLEQAREFAGEYGGVVLAIDATGLAVRQGKEYPHPVVRGVIPAHCVKAI